MRVVSLFTVTAAWGLGACLGDESLSGYAEQGVVYALTEVGDTAFTSRATFVLGPNGGVYGEAPCNRWQSEQTAPYPWFAIGPIVTTRLSCPELEAERLYFSTLEAMTISEVSGNVLILSNTDGGRMLFQAE